jgi:hypothetical protein
MIRSGLECTPCPFSSRSHTHTRAHSCQLYTSARDVDVPLPLTRMCRHSTVRWQGIIFLGIDPAHPEAQTLMHIDPQTGCPEPLLPPDVAVARASRIISKEEELLRE